MSFFENHGLIVGVALLSLVVVGALALGRKAAKSVREFREDHHETFTGTKNK